MSNSTYRSKGPAQKIDKELAIKNGIKAAAEQAAGTINEKQSMQSESQDTGNKEITSETPPSVNAELMQQILTATLPNIPAQQQNLPGLAEEIAKKVYEAIKAGPALVSIDIEHAPLETKITSVKDAKEAVAVAATDEKILNIFKKAGKDIGHLASKISNHEGQPMEVCW